MNSRLRASLIVTLSSLAAFTLLGAGFASWVFKHENISSKQASASVLVVSSVSKGSISIISSPEIVTFSQGVGRKDDLTDGIVFFSKEEEGGKMRYQEQDKISLRYEVIDERDSIEGNSWKLFISIEDEALSDLICLTGAFSSADEAMGGYDFSSKVKIGQNESDGSAYFEYTLSLNEAIQFKSKETKPLTESTYSSLYSVLESSRCKITVKFVVV